MSAILLVKLALLCLISALPKTHNTTGRDRQHVSTGISDKINISAGHKDKKKKKKTSSKLNW